MAFNTSPPLSIDPSIASLLASASLIDARLDTSAGSPDVATSPVEVPATGKSTVSFLLSLDAVT